MAARTDSRQASPRALTSELLSPHFGTSPQLPAQALSTAQVEATLRSLPSHGWTGGWTGRRDRALLVLFHMAGLSDEDIGELTVADITVADGTAIIRTPSGTTTLEKNDDDLICAPCALARWLHALDMTVLYPSGRVIAAVIARAAPLKADSPHLCQGAVTPTPTTQAMPLLPASEIRATNPHDEPAVIKAATTRPVHFFSGRIPAQRTTGLSSTGR